MSIYRMHYSQIRKFIELYRDAECLWNTEIDDYKQRKVRKVALKHIADEMKIDGFGPRHVARKIKILRITYNRELKKIADSIADADSPSQIYQPRLFWFRMIDGFLKKSSEMVSHDIKRTNDSSSEQVLVETDINEDNSKTVSINGVLLKRKCVYSLLEEAMEKKQRLQAASATSVGLTSVPQGNSPSETEFDVWCRSLAKQMNILDTSRALNLQLKIQSLVSKERTDYEKSKLSPSS